MYTFQYPFIFINRDQGYFSVFNIRLNSNQSNIAVKDSQTIHRIAFTVTCTDVSVNSIVY